MTARPHIAYVANMRLPSEKAHSVHVMSMCAVLGKLADVTLLIPNRHTKISTPDIYAHYGVDRTFDIERLKTWDAFRLPLPRRIAFYFHGWMFARAVCAWARRHPDTHFLCRDLYAAYRLARAGFPAAYEVHDLPQQRVRDFLRAVPKVVATNRAKYDRLVTDFGIQEGRLILASNAADVARFSDAGASPIRVQLHIAPDQTLVVYAGQLFLWKGADTLVRAARHVSDVFFVLVGGLPEDTNRIERLIAAEGVGRRVRLLPQVPHAEVPGLLAAADILALPTSAETVQGREETSPIKAFEYLAAGKPIVASDLPTSREILDETTAFFFQPDDPADCGRAIRQAVALSRDQARRGELHAAQSRAAAAHSWEARAKSVLQFLLS